MKLQKLLDICAKKANFRYLGRGATQFEIESAEQSLGVVFPKDYKRFLSEIGYVFWFGSAIYGVSDQSDYSTVHKTKYFRSRSLPSDFTPLPLDGNVIETFAGGGAYFLYAASSPRAGEVVLFSDDEGGIEAESWPSFLDFFMYALDEGMEE